jgi:hypothetical protein
MHWFRTIRAFIRVLVGLFLLAQFAGVVSSPLTAASAATSLVASHVHHHHDHAHSGSVPGVGGGHEQQSKGHVDDCCALHAFFAGVLPSVAAVTSATRSGERLALGLAESGAGIPPGGLDRPPKPLP